MNENAEKSGSGRSNPWRWASGIAIGIAIGVALGVAMNHIGAGLLMGLGLGVAFGVGFTSAARRRGDAGHDGRDETTHDA